MGRNARKQGRAAPRGPRSLYRFRLLAILLPVLLSAGCAALRPALPPPSEEVANTVLSMMEEQEGKVSSFYSLGSITLKNWLREFEADSVIVGTLDPFRIKIEITHPWGQPVLHLLIHGRRLSVFSFRENILYVGELTPQALSRFLPGRFDARVFWSTLKAYPLVLGHDRVSPAGGNRLKLIENGRKVEEITVDAENLQPAEVVLPDYLLRLSFMKYRGLNGIRYAGEVKASPTRGSGTLHIRNRKMVFNTPIPDEIFTIDLPPGAEARPLEDLQEN